MTVSNSTSIHNKNSSVHLPLGAAMLLPTIEIPPDAFGSPENFGFLDAKNNGLLGHCMLVYDPSTNVPQKGTIALCYLTKSGPSQ
jgi:hypothetical protein